MVQAIGFNTSLGFGATEKVYRPSPFTAGEVRRALLQSGFEPNGTHKKNGHGETFERKATVSVTIPAKTKEHVSQDDINDIKGKFQALGIPLNLSA